MEAYKRFILTVIILVVGILAPCYLSIDSSCFQDEIGIEERTYTIEADDSDVSVTATMFAENVDKKEKRAIIKAVKKKRANTSVIVLRERLITYQFYGREAGGIPAETTFLLAS